MLAHLATESDDPADAVKHFRAATAAVAPDRFEAWHVFERFYEEMDDLRGAVDA